MQREPVPNPNPSGAAPPGVPREIGPYQVQRVLGAGGMATVYAALQKQPRRTVAIKVMKAGIAQSRGESAIRRFKREIEILGKLSHPYIAAVYDAGTFDDGSGATPYFVMEYIAGASNILEYIVRKDLNQRERLKLFVKVCAAVEHGHRNRIIHRDLKPGNILIDQYGEPKVIDFGIATAAEVDVSHQTLQADAGRIVGTLQYMAPEQVEARGVDLDGRCDVYALGVLLYRMTTGKAPYDLEALPVYEAVRIIREERPPRPSDVNPEVRGDLETIILKAMEPDRARRYRSAGSLGRDVVRLLASKPIKARRAGALYRLSLFARRNAAMLGVIATIAVIAGAAVTYTLWERSRLSARQEQDRQALADRERRLQQRSAEILATTQAAAGEDDRSPITLVDHTGAITRLAFARQEGSSPLLVSAAMDHQALLWNINERTVLRRASPLGSAVRLLALSSNGSMLAAASDDARDPLALVDLSKEQSPRTVREIDGPATALALSPSGAIIAWGAATFTLHAGTTRIGEDFSADSIRSSTGAFTAIAFADSERCLVAGTRGGAIWLWEPQARSSRAPPPRTAAKRLSGLHQPIVALSLLERDGERSVIAVAEDGSACAWREDGEEWQPSPMRVANSALVAAGFSGNGRHLVTVTADRAQAWRCGVDDASIAPVGPAIAIEDDATAAAIDEDAALVAIGCSNGDIKVHRLHRGDATR